MVADLKAVAKSYDEKQVFRDVSFVIDRGDRVALVGVNGAGKSTLIKLLAGIEPVSGGELRLGHNVEADYFAQDQYKELDPEARMLDDLWNLAPTHTQTQLRSLLGAFLFSEDDVFKRLGVLSGGERNRYALARMLLRPSNFLLLDEPTNHLDMRAKDMLLEALEQYTGTVVFVSHDRYFSDKLATRVFEIGEGEVRVYPGNYEDYLWRKQNRGETPSQETHVPASQPGGNGSEPPPALRQKKINPYKLREMEQQREQLETEIARVEGEIVACEQALQVFVSAEETQRQSTLLEQRRRELAAKMAQWEAISHALGAAT
jgi:ATP-binding cassette subfamily F protein 3